MVLSGRLNVLRATVLALIAILLCRLLHLQVMGADPALDVAGSSTRTIAQPALRGRILDTSGRPLMANRTRLVVTVDDKVLQELDESARARVFARLSRVLGDDPGDLQAMTVPCGAPAAKPAPECWTGSPVEPVPVAWDVGPEQVLAIVERRELFPGVAVKSRPDRYAPRPFGVGAANVLGYLGPDGSRQVGRSGLEQTYEQELRGIPGKRTVVVDAYGRRTAVVRDVSPRQGNDLLTSIDARIQAAVEGELKRAMRRAAGKRDRLTGRPYVADSGAAVVLEVRTGRVVAMASRPSYDPNIWSGGLSEHEHGRIFDDTTAPLLFRAIQGEYAPGSTFKPVTAIAALRNGYPPSTVLPCPGTMTIGGRTFRNYRSIGYGPTSFVRALATSCDTFFYRIGLDMWLESGRTATPLNATAADFGFGRRTGVDLPGEVAGRLPANPSYPGIAALGAIGQADLAVTPLQLAVAYAAIANGGTLWKPRLGKAIVAPDGSLVRRIPSETSGNVPLTRRQSALLQRALRETTRSGTAAEVFAGFPLDKIPVASKTGTAEVAGLQPTSWFASFDRRYAVVMMVTQGGTGSGTSGPSVRRIWEALYHVDETSVKQQHADGTSTHHEGESR